jgi:hypothetical protein
LFSHKKLVLNRIFKKLIQLITNNIPHSPQAKVAQNMQS